MNYMTWDRAICLFPLATFHERKAYCTEGARNIDEETLSICRSADIKIFEAGEPPSLHNSVQGTFTAHVGSNHTWDIKFATDGKSLRKCIDSELNI